MQKIKKMNLKNQKKKVEDSKSEKIPGEKKELTDSRKMKMKKIKHLPLKIKLIPML